MDSSLERFRELLRLPTISRSDETLTDWEPFDAFVAALPRLYPALHAALTLEIVEGHSLLYRWKGSGDGAPAVLMAHYDVVHATDEGWEHPPFAAELVGDGEEAVLWGRGAIDDKGALVSTLEAAERLAERGYIPANDVYLSFGHNEETAGGGAAAAAAVLEGRGIRPALVLDEGGAVVEDIFPGVAGPIAVIGVSEKGLAGVRLSVEQEGGHASTPPRFAATVRLARAIVRLNSKPFPAGFSSATLEMVRTLGSHSTGPLRFAANNLWLTRGALLGVFSRLGVETSAMVRTTQAVTELSGSGAANALAERATATVNVRVAVGSSVAEAVAHIRRAVRDPLVTVEVIEASEPSPISPSSGPAWELLTETIEFAYPGTIVTPYVQLGASDSRRFTGISDHVYRFSPFELSFEERSTLHAMNERIRVATWLRGIDFYEKLISEL
ncbi:M20/M25/M40 family metallo-hydrolase [Glaciihabitans arcticus]|uniref:M20/M25/M40 family metallo-hydrolase n=1 Tax=Glaciihabitans arcticus TaxID=2668039 RepID=A0A4Q9GW13_9MICO|nr:M20/M25/M40 family metallo-hydrolase [Glaciihabitans arcticus]TBN56390.1 M20/M25/M40 family metallo-hydrolase [Glaciihabitans arcticus]